MWQTLGQRREKLHLPWHTLELTGTSISQFDVRPGDDLTERSRHEHFTGASLRHHTRGEVHIGALDMGAVDLHFTDVHADPNLEIQRPDRLDERVCAPNGPLGCLEGDEESITRGVNLLSPIALETPARGGPEALKKLTP